MKMAEKIYIYLCPC